MADVIVELAAARSGRLPPVCAMSGEAADGAVPIRVDRSLRTWRSPTIRIPMSNAAFRRWSRRQGVMIRFRIAAMVLVVVALAFSARNALIALAALVAAGLVLGVSLRAERSLEEHQPGIERRRNTILLTGVHPSFAAAVERSEPPGP